MYNIDKVREDFPILGREVYKKPLVYLDNAATSQKPQLVIDAIAEAYSKWNSNIHRGVHHLSQIATMKHEQARKAVAEFIGASSSDEIVFTKGTTDSLNALAFSYGEKYVHEGDEIIVSAVEHHSNIVPWQMLCERKGARLRVIPMADDGTLLLEDYRAKLDSFSCTVPVFDQLVLAEFINAGHMERYISRRRRNQRRTEE
jgi:cysteine desulfurase/selenocysteine lyase